MAVWQCGSRFYKLTRAHTRICFRKQPPHCHTATHPPPHDSVLIFVILCLALSDLSEEQVHGIHSAFMLSNVLLCNSFFLHPCCPIAVLRFSCQSSEKILPILCEGVARARFFAPLLTGNLSPKKCTLFGGGLVCGRPATDPRETREKIAVEGWRGNLKNRTFLRCAMSHQKNALKMSFPLAKMSSARSNQKPMLFATSRNLSLGFLRVIISQSKNRM